MVPENRQDPGSDLIALPVVRIRATGGDPAEPIFRLEGGPGITNMSFPTANRLTDRHDVVLVGYRGVDGSAVLECPEVESALQESADFACEESLRRYAEAFADCAQRLAEEGVDLDGYSLAQRVDDLEAARQALGYERINLISENAGTRTAMIYAWRYPESIHRSVMMAVNPPGHFLWDPAVTDDQLDYYANLCAKDDGCAARTDDLAASIGATAADMPDRWASCRSRRATSERPRCGDCSTRPKRPRRCIAGAGSGQGRAPGCAHWPRSLWASAVGSWPC